MADDRGGNTSMDINLSFFLHDRTGKRSRKYDSTQIFHNLTSFHRFDRRIFNLNSFFHDPSSTSKNTK